MKLTVYSNTISLSATCILRLLFASVRAFLLCSPVPISFFESLASPSLSWTVTVG